MYAPFHSSRAVCTPGRCSGAWSLLFYKKGTCLSRGFHQLFTKEWGEGGFCLPLPSLSFLPPIPPPPFPGGEGGESKFSYARGFAPCIPGAGRDAALARPKVSVCLRGAVPAAKERGDRGRGTSAFEMVLSPGAGRASAARGQAPPADTTAAGQAGDHPPAPPAGDVDGRDSQCRPGKPPAGHLLGKGYKRRVGSGVGMQGAKPLA